MTGVRITIRGGLTMNHRSMTGRATPEIMTLDAARETMSFGNTDDIDEIAGGEAGDRDCRANIHAVDPTTKFAYMLLDGEAEF
jgi:hypothetical protein